MLFKSHIWTFILKHTWELAWVIEGTLCKTPSNFRNFHGQAGGNCVNTSNFETHKSRYLQPKGSIFVLLVGFPIVKFLF